MKTFKVLSALLSYPTEGLIDAAPEFPAILKDKPSDDYDVVDCAVTPNSDVLILERHFSWRRGVAMRIRRDGSQSMASIAPRWMVRLISPSTASTIGNTTLRGTVRRPSSVGPGRITRGSILLSAVTVMTSFCD